MNMEFSYKSFCWCLGTTSFRTKNFNKTIETQLGLLDSFWNLPENNTDSWQGNDILQTRYYDYMKNNNFVYGEAKNKPKDAREKTSGLVDFGLVMPDRKLSKVGKQLLQMSRKNDFVSDNFFNIPKDSFLFAKQLLKTSVDVDSEFVRPFIILIYALEHLEYITFEEFMYLLPLCTNSQNTEEIIDKIKQFRTGAVSIDDIIFNRIINMDNYKAALQYFLDSDVTEDVICTVGINRKSRSYDKAYYPLYVALKSIYLDNKYDNIPELLEAVKGLSSGISGRWKKILFSTPLERNIRKLGKEALNATIFDNITSEEDFKRVFFRLLQTNKAKATLSDYFDLNRRYFKTSDLVLFQENKVELDTIPKYFFAPIVNCLYQDAFVESNSLFDDISLEEISPCLELNKEDLLARLSKRFGVSVKTLEEANQIVEDERYKRLQQLIDDKFTDEKILALLDMFQCRADQAIQEQVTDNADIPTIFEYVLGILWYKISEHQGKVLDYMKLSLGADLLPKTHAAGGEADIVYEYPETDYYPEHSLLLEATLADSTNQRRMEMEPVSRHLGQHLLRTKNMNSYCVFATNYLHPNVVSDFRSRKNVSYYDQQDDTKCVESMKIIPLSTDDLKAIIRTGRKYRELYQIFDNAYKDEAHARPLEWRKQMIENVLFE